MREAEQMIRPLEEVFDKRKVEILKSTGVEGYIPIELSVDELMAIAKRKGYEADILDGEGIRFLIVLEKKGTRSVPVYAIREKNDELVILLDPDVERFKEVFMK